IKSLSNFLLVLVKDLNYFSESNIERGNLILDLKETNIMDVIRFCKEIAESLLKKSNKIGAIDFSVHLDEEVPRIVITDEWRLKQILINLLSNAIKFTICGEISLIVTKIEEKIKFLIKDTGLGMKPETQANLFKPFKKDRGK